MARATGWKMFAVQSMSYENTLEAARRYFYSMIAFEIPRDPEGSEMIVLSDIKNFVFNWLRDTHFGIMRARLRVDEGRFSKGFIGPFSLRKDFS